MTSEEILASIRKAESPGSSEESRWLREIAYQLAVSNENHKPLMFPAGSSITFQLDSLSDPQPGKRDAEVEPGGLWPKIAPDGSGRFGIWFGPGPARHSLDTEAEARAHIQDWARRMNEYQPGSRVSEPSSATRSTTQKEICKPGQHDLGAIRVPNFDTLCIKCGLSIREISEQSKEHA